MVERMLRKIAWVLPRRLAYWCAIRVVTAASVNDYHNVAMGDIRATDALACWR